LDAGVSRCRELTSLVSDEKVRPRLMLMAGSGIFLWLGGVSSSKSEREKLKVAPFLAEDEPAERFWVRFCAVSESRSLREICLVLFLFLTLLSTIG